MVEAQVRQAKALRANADRAKPRVNASRTRPKALGASADRAKPNVLRVNTSHPKLNVVRASADRARRSVPRPPPRTTRASAGSPAYPHPRTVATFRCASARLFGNGTADAAHSSMSAGSTAANEVGSNKGPPSAAVRTWE